MSRCYDYDLQKWTVLSLGLMAVTMTIGLALMQVGHGQTNNTETNLVNFGISASDATVISAIAALIAAGVASGGLIYNARSFNRLQKADESREKAEELRVLEGTYREIAHGMKEYRLLEAESLENESLNPDYLKHPEKEEEEKIRSEKIRVLLSENFADISWLCFLIRHDIIKDSTLVNAFKDQIVDWYEVFAQERPDDVGNLEVFPDFQILAQQYILEKIHKKEHGIPKRHWYSKLRKFFKIGPE